MSAIPALITSQKREQIPAPAPPGPPFALNSADNGLSVDPVSGKIVLGNDVGLFTAILLSDRELPMAGFKWSWLNGTNRQFVVDPLLDQFILGDYDNASNGMALLIDDGTQAINIGALSTGNFTQILIDDGSGMVINTAGTLFGHKDVSSNRYLVSDPVNGLYQFGDIDGAGNRTLLSVDDGNFVVDLGSVAGGNFYEMDVSTGEVVIFGGGALQVRFSPVTASGVWEIGDLGGLANGTRIIFDDATGIFSFANTTNTSGITINGMAGFTGTVTPVTSITVEAGIVTNVT